MTAKTKFSRYSLTDKEALFRIETSLPAPATLRAEISCGNVITRVPCAAMFEAALPLDRIPEGTHSVNIRIFRGTKLLGNTVVPLIKMDLPEGAARINNYAKCLTLNGKNTFFFMPMIGTYPGPEKLANQWADWLYENGFKHCIFAYLRKHGFQKAVKFLKRAKEHGISVVIWNMEWFNDDDEERFSKEFKQLSETGCVAAWKVLDEPDLHYKSDVAKNYMLRMMKRIPKYPVFMNNTILGIPNRYADYTSDILMLDSYLTSDTSEQDSVRKQVLRPLEHVVLASKSSRNQPCWNWLVGNNTHNAYREPTGPEQVAQTWGSVVTGATGLAYFSGSPKCPGNWKAYKTLNQEILALNDVILSEEKSANALLSNREFYWMTRKFQGCLYVFAVNVDYAAHENITVSLPSEYRYADDVEVVFESRKLKLKDGRFTDSFPELSRHIYKIKLQ